MNASYLFQFVADLLQTWVRLLSTDGNIQSSFQCQNEVYDYLSHSPEVFDFVLADLSPEIPCLSSVNQDFTYCAIALEKQIILVGPLRLYSHQSITHNIHVELSETFFNQRIYSCELNVYVRSILLLHNLLSPSAITEEQFVAKNFSDFSNEDVQKYYSNLLFANREEGISHNPYMQELRMLSSIESGDIDLLMKTYAEDEPTKLGILADSSDRNFRNICISVITLVSRAAIRGGVNPEIAFSLCDSYSMKIEGLKILDELKPLVEGAKMHFATMVREIKDTQQRGIENKRHPLLEQSKDYIFSHIHDKITMQEISKKINVSPNYLSELFRKYEGISFTDFVMKEKMSLVKNMLIYSPYSYIEIATYLGFSSQSHLGKQFKAITGMTLKQFRNLYSTTQFQNRLHEK